MHKIEILQFASSFLTNTRRSLTFLLSHLLWYNCTLLSFFAMFTLLIYIFLLIIVNGAIDLILDPGKSAKYCSQRVCMSVVCLFVCVSARISE